MLRCWFAFYYDHPWPIHWIHAYLYWFYSSLLPRIPYHADNILYILCYWFVMTLIDIPGVRYMVDIETSAFAAYEEIYGLIRTWNVNNTYISIYSMYILNHIYIYTYIDMLADFMWTTPGTWTYSIRYTVYIYTHTYLYMHNHWYHEHLTSASKWLSSLATICCRFLPFRLQFFRASRQRPGLFGGLSAGNYAILCTTIKNTSRTIWV